MNNAPWSYAPIEQVRDITNYFLLAALVASVLCTVYLVVRKEPVLTGLVQKCTCCRKRQSDDEIVPGDAYNPNLYNLDNISNADRFKAIPAARKEWWAFWR